MARRATLATALVLLGGCPTGMDLPPETRMVKIQGGNFTIGQASSPSGLICGGGPKITPYDHCDLGGKDDPAQTVILKLTWVPSALAYVSDFEIDEHEVTNAQYAVCVDDQACTPPALDRVGGAPYYGDPQYDDFPVVYVSWQQARDYCRHVNKRLPNEAEWERAARLDRKGALRTYPWAGDVESTCNPSRGDYALSAKCELKAPLPVTYSQADVTDYGVRNVASNVAEWTSDGWHAYAYCENQQPYPATCQKNAAACAACASDGAKCARSCAQDGVAICKAGRYSSEIVNSTEHVVRGGSYLHSACYNRLFVRHRGSTPRPEVGFRCAR